MRKHIQLKQGFTLVEIMIVVVIVGILAGLAIPRYMKATTRAKQTEAKMILKQIYVMEQWARQENDDYWIPPDGSEASAANPEAFAELGVEIMPQARYRYLIRRSDQGFTAEAYATNLDDDPAEDRWKIDQSGELVVLSNDAVR
jgi:prepilin-type N-terminal cleavage/methylation domain-containing protein